MSKTPIGREKALLRKAMRNRLQKLSASQREEGGRAIARQLEGLLEALGVGPDGGAVAFFANLSWEIPTTPLDLMLQRLRVQRVLPSVEGRTTLTFRRLPASLSVADMPRDRMGIPTPGRDLSPVDPGHCALLILPGLAFDVRGGRLGQGGGYYDRELARIRGSGGPGPLMVGIGFDLQLLDEVPMGPEDQAIGWVCTPERGLIPVSGLGSPGVVRKGPGPAPQQ